VTTALDITVSIRLAPDSIRGLASMGQMDAVSVIVNTGSDSYFFYFSRVPAIGEQIRIRDLIYTVRNVIHTPNHAHAAEITVAFTR
jgi:hypothetical protein